MTDRAWLISLGGVAHGGWRAPNSTLQCVYVALFLLLITCCKLAAEPLLFPPPNCDSTLVVLPDGVEGIVTYGSECGTAYFTSTNIYVKKTEILMYADEAKCSKFHAWRDESDAIARRRIKLAQHVLDHQLSVDSFSEERAQIDSAQRLIGRGTEYYGSVGGKIVSHIAYDTAVPSELVQLNPRYSIHAASPLRVVIDYLSEDSPGELDGLGLYGLNPSKGPVLGFGATFGSVASVDALEGLRWRATVDFSKGNRAFDLSVYAYPTVSAACALDDRSASLAQLSSLAVIMTVPNATFIIPARVSGSFRVELTGELLNELVEKIDAKVINSTEEILDELATGALGGSVRLNFDKDFFSIEHQAIGIDGISNAVMRSLAETMFTKVFECDAYACDRDFKLARVGPGRFREQALERLGAEDTSSQVHTGSRISIAISSVLD